MLWCAWQPRDTGIHMYRQFPCRTTYVYISALYVSMYVHTTECCVCVYNVHIKWYYPYIRVTPSYFVKNRLRLSKQSHHPLYLTHTVSLSRSLFLSLSLPLLLTFQPSTDSPTHSLAHSLTRSLIHTLTHSLTQSLAHPLTH